MASYLVPEFEPPDARDVPGLMHQPLAGQGRELMRRFPESAWHRDEDYRQLQRLQIEAEQRARSDRQEAEKLRAQLENAQEGRSAAERNANKLEDELRGKNTRIHDVERDLRMTWQIGGGAVTLLGLFVIVIIVVQLVSRCSGPSQVPPPPGVEADGAPTQPQEEHGGRSTEAAPQPSKPAGSKDSQSSSDNR